MGAHLLSIVLFSLLTMTGIELFMRWYPGFLERRQVPPDLRRFIPRLLWAILTVLFWSALIRKPPAEFTASHFYFALFIMCFFRLLCCISPLREQKKDNDSEKFGEDA